MKHIMSKKELEEFRHDLENLTSYDKLREMNLEALTALAHAFDPKSNINARAYLDSAAAIKKREGRAWISYATVAVGAFAVAAAINPSGIAGIALLFFTWSSFFAAFLSGISGRANPLHALTTQKTGDYLGREYKGAMERINTQINIKSAEANKVEDVRQKLDAIASKFGQDDAARIAALNEIFNNTDAATLTAATGFKPAAPEPEKPRFKGSKQ